MNKKAKRYLGLGVALGGVALSIGASYALYTQGANDISFTIGAYTYTVSTGTVEYKIGDVTTTITNSSDSTSTEAKASSSTAPSPEYPYVHMTFPLGAEYASDVPAQKYVSGSIAVSASKASALENTDVNITANVVGYASGTYWGDHTDNDDNGKAWHLGDITDSVPVALTTASTQIGSTKDIGATVTGSDKPTTSNTQYLLVTVDFSALTAANFLALAETEEAFSVSVTWSEVTSDYAAPYVTGDYINWSTSVDEYRMVPNLAAESYEWMFSNLTGFTVSKCVNGSTWSTINSSNTTDTDGNAVLDASKTYDVYWDGKSTGAAYYGVHSS